MKKAITTLLLVSLVLCLYGCNFPAVPPETTAAPTVPPETLTTAPQEATTAPPVQTEPVEIPIPQAQLVALSLPVVTESAKADNGTVIFSYTFPNISLIAPDPDVAQLVIVDFLNRIDGTRIYAENIYSLAASAYNGSGNWNPYLCTISYNPMRVDVGVLSLFGSQTGYSGSPHPETVFSALNYDLVTGKLLKLGDVLTEEASIDVLLQQVLDVLKTREKELYLYEGYEKTVSATFAGNALQRSWYFTGSGLCFYFAPYEIAPYATGVVTAEIPYSQLAGIVRDRYFPAEQDLALGSLEVQPFDPGALEQFQRFAEVVLDTSGEKILLHTEHMIQNLRLDVGVWSASGTRYTPQHTVFAASALVAGDGLMVEGIFPEEKPPLRLRYESNGETISVFLARTPDGIILLPQ